MEKLAEKHEAKFENRWKMDAVSKPKLDMMLKMIVGFEIEISRIKGKSKLSQNRSIEDRVGIIAGLRDQRDGMALSIADKIELNLLS